MNQDAGKDDKEGFDTRLRAARTRHGLDPGAGKDSDPTNAPSLSAMGVGMRVGVELLAALVVGLAIGWALDRWLHTMPAFLALFVVLGGAAGIMNVWRLLSPGKGQRG